MLLKHVRCYGSVNQLQKSPRRDLLTAIRSLSNDMEERPRRDVAKWSQKAMDEGFELAQLVVRMTSSNTSTSPLHALLLLVSKTSIG